MAQRSAQASWTGDLRGGSGQMRTQSGAFQGSYSYDSRFGEAGGTNPEELIAAAHAGCFSMATASGLSKAGYKPKRVSTKATVHIEPVEGGFKIQRIELEMDAEVQDIEEPEFLKIAEATKKGCPVSQALAAVPEITLRAQLVSKAAKGA